MEHSVTFIEGFYPFLTEEERDMLRLMNDTPAAERYKQTRDNIIESIQQSEQLLADERDHMSQAEISEWERLIRTNIEELRRWNAMIEAGEARSI